MIFKELALPGAYIIQLQPIEDERGFFARSWCRREFEEAGLNSHLVQCNISFNRKKGTLRGMHLQLPPHAEAKLVRCTQGAVYDVIIDLRGDSPTYLQWKGETLTAENRNAILVPKGFAHGFLTLEDASEVFYQMSDFYAPESSTGVRWDDSEFGIKWPFEPGVISEKDQGYGDFDPDRFKSLKMNLH